MTLSSLDDSLDEANESLVVEVVNVSNGIENGVQQLTVTILDNDMPPTVTLSVATSRWSKTAVAQRSPRYFRPLRTNITVTLAFSGVATFSVDHSASTQIVIPAGATCGTIAFASLDDLLDELNETVTIDIATVDNGTEQGTQQQSITIVDDDGAAGGQSEHFDHLAGREWRRAVGDRSLVESVGHASHHQLYTSAAEQVSVSTLAARRHN